MMFFTCVKMISVLNAYFSTSLYLAMPPHCIIPSALYTGLFGWGYAILKIFPYVCTLEPLLFKKGRGQGLAICTGMSCGLCVMSQQCSLTCILVCLVGGYATLKTVPYECTIEPLLFIKRRGR